MYIAMNRFRINHGYEPGFEQLWRERESRLSELKGFVAFRLLKGPDDGECRLYASHTTWETQEDFDAWTQSEQFKKAHAQSKLPKETYAGHPVFEGFEVLLQELSDAH